MEYREGAWEDGRGQRQGREEDQGESTKVRSRTPRAGACEHCES